MGKPIKLVTPYPCYLSPGKINEKRQLAYKALFNQQIPDDTLKEIRNAINKAWVPGKDQFKKQIDGREADRKTNIARYTRWRSKIREVSAGF